MANNNRLSKKRAFADSTIQIQEDSESDGEEYEDEQDSSEQLP